MYLRITVLQDLSRSIYRSLYMPLGAYAYTTGNSVALAVFFIFSSAIEIELFESERVTIQQKLTVYSRQFP